MHIIKRGAVYYYRRRIPLDLVAAHSGQHEVYHSLHTKDRTDAARKARRQSVTLDDLWSDMRGTAPATPDTLAPDAAGTPQHDAVAEGLEAMLPIWKRERRPNNKTEDAYARAVNEFNELHRSPALSAITRGMVILYRDQLQEAGKSIVTVGPG